MIYIFLSLKKKRKKLGNSLVQWLGLSTFTSVAWVQSLVRELSNIRKPPGTAKKKERNYNNKYLKSNSLDLLPYTLTHR